MTQLNCKAGDLAIVVNTELSQNLGQIVEVLGLPTGLPFTMSLPGHLWQVRAVSGRRTLFYRFHDTGRLEEHSEGPAPDRCLRPVSGLRGDDALMRDFGTDSVKRCDELVQPQPAQPVAEPIDA